MFLIRKYSLIISYLALILTSLAPGSLALAADPTGAKKALGGLNDTAEKGGIQAGETDLPTIIGKVIGAVLAFVGAIFFGNLGDQKGRKNCRKCFSGTFA